MTVIDKVVDNLIWYVYSHQYQTWVYISHWDLGIYWECPCLLYSLPEFSDPASR